MLLFFKKKKKDEKKIERVIQKSIKKLALQRLPKHKRNTIQQKTTTSNVMRTILARSSPVQLDLFSFLTLLFFALLHIIIIIIIIRIISVFVVVDLYIYAISFVHSIVNTSTFSDALSTSSYSSFCVLLLFLLFFFRSLSLFFSVFFSFFKKAELKSFSFCRRCCCRLNKSECKRKREREREEERSHTIYSYIIYIEREKKKKKRRRIKAGIIKCKTHIIEIKDALRNAKILPCIIQHNFSPLLAIFFYDASSSSSTSSSVASVAVAV